MPGMFQVVFASSTPCLHPHALKGPGIEIPVILLSQQSLIQGGPGIYTNL